jgi:hypothetical protein
MILTVWTGTKTAQKTYFLPGYGLWAQGTKCCLESFQYTSALMRLQAKTGLGQPKSARSAAHSARITSLHLFPVASSPHHCLTAFRLKTMFLLLLRSSKSSHCSILCRALNDDSAESHLHGDRGSAHPQRSIYTITWMATMRILFIFPLCLPSVAAAGLRKLVNS